MKIAQVGFGYLGKAYNKVLKDPIVYDPFSDDVDKFGNEVRLTTQADVNACDIAIVAVPTDPLPDGTLDMSIVESTVDWLETPLILIKSALMPGTVDRLVAKTGKKIAVSVEFIGMGNYYIPPDRFPDPKDPSKHDMLIVGGELETATRCAEVLWAGMSPTIRIHLVTALEAEITKLVENAYGALKVTWINSLMSLTDKAGANFIRVHQAWTSDGRVDGMHQRALSYNRGWKSHCWDKDIPALAAFAESVGATDVSRLFNLVGELNKEHLALNDSSSS